MITPDILRQLGVSEELSERYGESFNLHMHDHGINTQQREACFIAQVLHESGMLRHVREGMSYSWGGLRATFPRQFQTDAIAREYERDQERIGNRAYAGRMGNGDEASGDGYRYRGSGFMQLTGKETQAKYRAWAGDDGTIDPVLSAVWFWAVYKDLNHYADAMDIRGLTKAINGGYNGLDDRECLTEMALKVV